MSALPFATAMKQSPFKGATFLVHLMVADIVNEQHEWRFFMSVPRFAAKCRLNEGTVRRCLRELEDAGWLTVEDGAEPAERARRARVVRYVYLEPADAAIVYDEGAPPRAYDAGSMTPTPRVGRGDPARTTRAPRAPRAGITKGELKENSIPLALVPSARAAPTGKSIRAAWFRWHEGEHGAVPTSSPPGHVERIIDRALRAGATEPEVKAALRAFSAEAASGARKSRTFTDGILGHFLNGGSTDSARREAKPSATATASSDRAWEIMQELNASRSAERGAGQ